MGIALLSTVGATSPYLGFVQISQEIKYLIAFLFAVNCLDSKSAVRVLILVGVAILVTQAGMTLLRYSTGYITPLIPSGVSLDLAEMEKYLEVDRTAQDSAVRGYGTLNSPGSTTQQVMHDGDSVRAAALRPECHVSDAVGVRCPDRLRLAVEPGVRVHPGLLTSWPPFSACWHSWS